MDVIDKLNNFLNEAAGFVQKLPYQEKKAKMIAKNKSMMKKSREKENLEPEESPALVKKGDIFYNSWGYDQTNIDFYQVVDITKTGKSVKLKEIEQKVKGDSMAMSGHTVALKGKFKKGAKLITKKIQKTGTGEVFLKFNHGWTTLWDGKPKYVSWYA